MYLPGVPCHIIQRGNNREACFFAEQDYHFYLDCLRDACERYRVSVHAYVLMTNHVHALMTPNTKDGISRVMQSIGRRYVQYINKAYQRCGTLWESRHKASLIDAKYYLLACYRYIELNPVAAAMVQHPIEYAWSSYHYNAYGEPNALLTPHQLYKELGMTVEEQQTHYRKLFKVSLDREDDHAIRTAACFSMPLGGNRFIQQIEKALGRRIGHSKRGRPYDQPRTQGDSDQN
jgi:putative transposase